MAARRKVPRPFEMHWGAGQIVEEASFSGEYHESCLQLMEYDAGGFSVRFAVYTLDGRFNRTSLMVGEEDLAGLHAALDASPRLREILRRLVE